MKSGHIRDPTPLTCQTPFIEEHTQIIDSDHHRSHTRTKDQIALTHQYSLSSHTYLHTSPAFFWKRSGLGCIAKIKYTSIFFNLLFTFNSIYRGAATDSGPLDSIFTRALLRSGVVGVPLRTDHVPVESPSVEIAIAFPVEPCTGLKFRPWPETLRP